MVKVKILSLDSWYMEKEDEGNKVDGGKSRESYTKYQNEKS